MSRETPEQVLKSIVDGINTANLDALMSLYEPEAAFARGCTTSPGRWLLAFCDRQPLGNGLTDLSQCCRPGFTASD